MSPFLVCGTAQTFMKLLLAQEIPSKDVSGIESQNLKAGDTKKMSKYVRVRSLGKSPMLGRSDNKQVDVSGERIHMSYLHCLSDRVQVF